MRRITAKASNDAQRCRDNFDDLPGVREVGGRLRGTTRLVLQTLTTIAVHLERDRERLLAIGPDALANVPTILMK